jgi:hypothetical protein
VVLRALRARLKASEWWKQVPWVLQNQMTRAK